jgi:hypothetical protein
MTVPPIPSRLAAPARLSPLARTVAGTAAAVSLAAGVAAFAVGEGMLWSARLERSLGGTWPRAVAMLAGLGLLVVAGRATHAAITGRPPGPWRRWMDGASQVGPGFHVPD